LISKYAFASRFLSFPPATHATLFSLPPLPRLMIYKMKQNLDMVLKMKERKKEDGLA
jgi:hypothetical protein